jgi:2-polyprenyl-6-methoxyphenol hydroxylase-like FAD-dependent oxidoreductase
MSDEFEDGRGRAIVVGASMAGLLAARALANHFNDVLLVERDDLGADSAYRRGVPQGRHTHALLSSGYRVLETFFPGISRELQAAGATSGDVALNVGWFVEGALLCRSSSELEGLGVSRALLETVVRSRVLALPNVHVSERAGVDGLAASPDRRRIIGARIGGQSVRADLLVDASGRGSRSPSWLAELGYQAPRIDKIDIELRYTTRLFRRRPQELGGRDAFVIPPPPAGKRGGVIIAQEGDRWTVTLMSHFSDFPPSELAAFVEFTRTLPAPDIYDVVRVAEPIGEAQTIRIPASSRRRYELLKRFPAGYLVLGDALSSFNPIYGQGMSVAALEAAALNAVLLRGRHKLARRFFRRAAAIVDTAWSISAGSDLRMPEATGERNAGTRFLNWYVARLLQAGHDDPLVTRTFLKVSNLLAPPASLLQPSMLWRVARAAQARR